MLSARCQAAQVPFGAGKMAFMGGSAGSYSFVRYEAAYQVAPWFSGSPRMLWRLAIVCLVFTPLPYAKAHDWDSHVQSLHALVWCWVRQVQWCRL